MTRPMIYDGEAAEDSRITRTGGIPLVPPGFGWPACAQCDGPMQFIAQILADDVPTLDGILLIFMCQNDPGMCDDWEPTSGGNKAFLVPAGNLAAAVPPPSGMTLLGAVSAMRFLDPACTQDQSRFEAVPPQDALGMMGGDPDWIQGDETPDCPVCSQPMTFVAQLEQGRDHQTAINFGDAGCGYAFACPACQQASFLWQCS